MNRIHTAVILLIISIAISCNKPHTKGVTTFVTSDSLFKFVNQMPVSVTLDLYKSVADKNNNTNVLYSLTLPGEGQATIPLRLFDTSVTYFIDLYSADFTFTNWGYYLYDTLGMKFGVFGQTRYTTGTYQISQLRNAYLKGNNTSTTWHAVDFYWYNYSEEWASLSANEQYIKLVINKSMIFQLYHKNTSGTIVADTITSISTINSLGVICGFYLYGNTGMDDELYNASSPQAALESPQKPSTDTILLRYQNKGYYVMVRQ